MVASIRAQNYQPEIYASQNFNTIAQSVPGFDSARIICIPQTNNPEDKRKSQWLISLLQKPGDLVVSDRPYNFHLKDRCRKISIEYNVFRSLFAGSVDEFFKTLDNIALLDNLRIITTISAVVALIFGNTLAASALLLSSLFIFFMEEMQLTKAAILYFLLLPFYFILWIIEIILSCIAMMFTPFSDVFKRSDEEKLLCLAQNLIDIIKQNPNRRIFVPANACLFRPLKDGEEPFKQRQRSVANYLSRTLEKERFVILEPNSAPNTASNMRFHSSLVQEKAPTLINRIGAIIYNIAYRILGFMGKLLGATKSIALSTSFLETKEMQSVDSSFSLYKTIKKSLVKLGLMFGFVAMLSQED